MYSAYPNLYPRAVLYRTGTLVWNCPVSWPAFSGVNEEGFQHSFKGKNVMTAASRREPSVSTEKDWAFAQPQNGRERSFSRGWKRWLGGMVGLKSIQIRLTI
jgi:hypothetical protein